MEIPRQATSVQYARSGGPGGQNVNKVASKVQLRVDLSGLGLDEAALARARTKLAGRLDADGWLLVESQKSRDQGKNLEDALLKAGQLIEAAIRVPRRRKATKPSRAAREKRLESKRATSHRKAQRRHKESE